MRSIFEAANSRWTGRMLSVLRIVVGILFIEHGTQKLFGFPPTTAMPVPVPLMSILGLASVIETFGGLAIMIGFFTRPVAFILAGEMAVAYFTVHHPKSPFPVVSGGEPAVLYCFIFLYVVFAGAGPWSVDAMLSHARRSEPPNNVPRHLDAAA